MENSNILNQLINGEVEMVRSAIAQKYQATRQDDKAKLRIDIMTAERLTDPIYITPDNEIVDGWKRLEILKELHNDNFKLAIDPAFVTVHTAEQQEEIYISKNVMVNRYKKSWLAIIAAENILPGNRRIAQARKGIKQEDNFDACSTSGMAFGISGKLVQWADEVLKSPHGSFLREKIRAQELTVTDAHEIVSRELADILDDMKNGKTYKAARNSLMREGQATRQHTKFQQREEFKGKNPMEYKEKNTPAVSDDESASQETVTSSSMPNQGNASLSLVSGTDTTAQQPTTVPLKAVSKQKRFLGALSGDCPVELRKELAILLGKYMPNSLIVFVQDRLKLQQLVHENHLEYTDYVEAA